MTGIPATISYISASLRMNRANVKYNHDIIAIKVLYLYLKEEFKEFLHSEFGHELMTPEIMLEAIAITDDVVE